ncbi:MAG: hypothetical protein KGL44_00740 [Sphingomonadales bacterium]|nr:hypothetical protein [Sphingomonadales bacterium]
MSKRRLARNAAASLAQAAITTVTMFLMYRLLLRSLSIEEVGLWALVIGSTAVARLSDMGLGAGVLRFVAGDIAAGRHDAAASTITMGVICAAALVGTVATIAYPLLLPLLLKGTPPALHAAAASLLQAALVSVVISTAANVFFNGIDGCQRMDIRSGLQVAGGLVQLGATALILPARGLTGLGAVQLIQSSFLLVMALFTCVRLVGATRSAWFHGERSRLRELFTYGGGLQVAAIGQMLFDPLVKALLTAFSGLELTGYFEMASRLILQCRAIYNAGFNALVPHVAARARNEGLSADEVRGIYREASNLLLETALPFFAMLASVLPLAVLVWIGRLDTKLLAVALILIIGWTFNTLNLPSYLLNVALGRLRWNILSHVVIGIATLALGLLLGPAMRGTGVLAAANLALIAGSGLVIAMFHREWHIRLGELVTPRQFWAIAVFFLAWACSTALVTGHLPDNLVAMIVIPALIAPFVLALLWTSPVRKSLTDQLGQSRK